MEIEIVRLVVRGSVQLTVMSAIDRSVSKKEEEVLLPIVSLISRGIHPDRDNFQILVYY